MRYEQFVSQVSPFAVFGKEVLKSLNWSFAAQNMQLNRWVKNGKIIRLKRDLYTLPQHIQKNPLSLMWLANTLYSPSYLSLEYVLSLYDLIPEKVEAITSISAHKTTCFKNKMGHFLYRHVKDNLFFGFEEKKDDYQTCYLIATPEKALLDLFYLTRNVKITEDYLYHNLRLQQLDALNKKLLINYTKKFDNERICQAVHVLLSLI